MYKRCSCNIKYNTIVEFIINSEFIGCQEDIDGNKCTYLLFNCECGSTMCINRMDIEQDTSINKILKLFIDANFKK